MCEIIKNYRDNEQLRHSFNELAIKTFGIDFEDWYQNGYWTDRYNPYSIIIDGKIVANVSVNTTDFEVSGELKHYIQLGTVMTDKEYRNKGFIRKIMTEIEKDFADNIDGMYLFAGDDVLSFYPKFEFQASKQYVYSKTVTGKAQKLFVQTPMKCKRDWDMLQSKIKASYSQSSFEMLDNSELNMFYVSKYMQENVFYSEALDTYVIAEIDNDTLTISSVISDREQNLNQIAEGFGSAIKNVKLGFTPKNPVGFEVTELRQDDCTLFVKGDFRAFEDSKLMFPLLAHA